MDSSSHADPTTATTPPAAEPRPLRLWPAVALLCSYWAAALLARPVGGFVTVVTLVGGGLLILLLLVGWWVGLSRARWSERLIIGLLALGGIVASNSIADSMTAGVPWIMFIAPWIATSWVAVAWLVRNRAPRERMVAVALTLLAGFATPLLVRFEGVSGAMDASPAFRFSQTAEERFLAELAARGADESVSSAQPGNTGTAPLAVGVGDWPGFRGPLRDGVVHGVGSLGDWSRQPPPLLWRRRIGPGWSSLAVVGDRIFTQEQRGEEELVSCYRLTDGTQLWTHSEPERFEEPAAGSGPRATPTFYDGRLYALGPRGTLLCLNPEDGQILWRRDLQAESAAAVPVWGFSASPLAIDGIVACLMAGPAGKGVVACDAASGEIRWTAGGGSHTYASCHAAVLNGVPQILSVTDAGIESLAVADGALLWAHAWALAGQARMLQPQLVDGERILLHSYLDGAEMLRVVHTGTDWTVEPQWRTKDLRSYFNDSVVRDGFLYGFNDRIFTCFDLATGKRQWLKGRYAHGQVLHIAAAAELLVLSEQGEAVLLAADPTGHRELGRFQAIEGKTWNHPTICRGRLLVRNAEEMACYDLSTAAPTQADPSRE